MINFINKYKSYASGLSEEEFISEINILININSHISDTTFEKIESALDDAAFEMRKKECELES